MENSDGKAIVNCGCWIVVVVVNFLLGGWSVNYLLSIFSHKIPFFWAGIIGIFVGELSMPVAVVVAILKSFNVI